MVVLIEKIWLPNMILSWNHFSQWISVQGWTSSSCLLGWLAQFASKNIRFTQAALCFYILTRGQGQFGQTEKLKPYVYNFGSLTSLRSRLGRSVVHAHSCGHPKSSNFLLLDFLLWKHYSRYLWIKRRRLTPFSPWNSKILGRANFWGNFNENKWIY